MTTVVSPPVPVLSQLEPVESRRMAQDRRWPKWSTQCLMHALGLPVLDACLVTPADRDRLAEAVETFAALHCASEVMVRSDGGVETATYQRGGHTRPVTQAVAWGRQMLAGGRAVLLLEPTNRFTNALTAMIRIDRQGVRATGGQLTIELLGPGFDLADLARSGLTPQMRVQVHHIDWERPEPLWPHDVIIGDVDRSDDTRIEARLAFVGAHCLPAGEAPGPGSAAKRGRAWLVEKGHTQLFQPLELASALQHLPDWHRDAYVIVAGLADRRWSCLATGWSDLGAGRQVYWDVIDGGRKYGRRYGYGAGR